MEVTFPRFILAEFNTHRMFSRNSASSRAIPVERRIAAIEADPFVPEAFGKNKKGMQASVDLDDDASAKAKATWINAMNDCIRAAKYLARLGTHKQHANRLLETYAWTTAIVSATEWDNFFALRTGAAAQPEMQRIASLMKEAYRASLPQVINEGEWHVPYVPDRDSLQRLGYSNDEVLQVSVGRCARVSYLTHDGLRDPEADIVLANELLLNGHMSPFEHVATPDPGKRHGNFFSWKQLRKFIANEHNFAARGT